MIFGGVPQFTSSVGFGGVKLSCLALGAERKPCGVIGRFSRKGEAASARKATASAVALDMAGSNR